MIGNIYENSIKAFEAHLTTEWTSFPNLGCILSLFSVQLETENLIWKWWMFNFMLLLLSACHIEYSNLNRVFETNSIITQMLRTKLEPRIPIWMIKKVFYSVFKNIEKHNVLVMCLITCWSIFKRLVTRVSVITGLKQIKIPRCSLPINLAHI